MEYIDDLSFIAIFMAYIDFIGNRIVDYNSDKFCSSLFSTRIGVLHQGILLGNFKTWITVLMEYSNTISHYGIDTNLDFDRLLINRWFKLLWVYFTHSLLFIIDSIVSIPSEIDSFDERISV